MEYLSLPLQLNEDYLARAEGLQESIKHSIGLILSTPSGSIHFMPEYGCDIWNLEYSDIATANKSDVRASLRNAIGQYEKRLYNVSVTFQKTKESSTQGLGMSVKVTGNFKEDSEEKKFEVTYSLG